MNKTPERPRKNFTACWPCSTYGALSKPPFVSDTAADEYSTGPGMEALSGAVKPSDADPRAPYFGGLMKVAVVMLFVLAIGIAVYLLNTLAPIATAPVPAP